MSISHYRLEQSELCRHLARLASDREVQARLLLMANEYNARAARAEAEEEEFAFEDDLLMDAARNPAPRRLIAYD